MAIAITVVIPTHDRRETALLAVHSALEQTRPPEQVLVVADGCTDGTADAVRDLGDARVEVLDQPKGPGYGYAHRNEALRRARGEVVAWLGDDDLYLPDHLERVGELFDAGLADLVSATTCVIGVDESLEATSTDWGVAFYRELLFAGENRAPASAVSHTVAAALATGGWRADLPRAADQDLWRRMLASGARPQSICTPTVLTFKATGRRQAYPDRVIQNTIWLERLRDPRELAALRAELNRSVHEHNAVIEQTARELQAVVPELQAVVERTQTGVELAHADALRVQGTLDAVLAGGWWRLRERLLALVRLAQRALPRPPPL